MSGRQLSVLLVGLLALIVISGSLFVVDEREYVALFQFGEIRRTDFEPGLHFKTPFVQNVRRFERRIITLDNQPERFLTAEKKNVIVDFFVKWRIKDVAAYYRATSGLETQAFDRLTDIIRKGLRAEFGRRTIQEAVSGERSAIMAALNQIANEQVAGLGLEIVDVRIQRIDLPDDVSESVYSRMRSERKRVASELRAQGAEAGERIRADADKQREVILANAYREAEIIRGGGDAKSADIYAQAYGKNSEFYSFHRSLGVYRETWRNRDDIMVLQPDGELFRYFNPPSSR